MLIKRVWICLSMILVWQFGFAQQTNLLETYRQTFEKQHQEFLNQYGFALNTVMETLKNKGDLDGVLLVKQEMERFTQQKTVSVPKSDKDLLYPVSKAYYVALAKLLERYINTLDALTKQEVAADRIDEAVKVREKKEKALSLASEIKEKAGIFFELGNLEGANSVKKKMDEIKEEISDNSWYIGKWYFADNKDTWIYQLNKDGTASAIKPTAKASGTWRVENKVLYLSWDSGWTDRIYLDKKADNSYVMKCCRTGKKASDTDKSFRVKMKE